MLGTFAARALTEAGAGVVAADLAPEPEFFRRFGPREETELRQASVLEPEDLRALLGSRRFAAVVLAAGPGSADTAADPRRAREVYVQGTREVCRAASAAGIRRLVLLSSFAVYGPRRRGTISEESPARPRTGYGRLKAAAETVAIEARDAGLEVRILRLCGIYGPAPQGRGGQAARLVDALLASALADREVLLDPGRFADDEILYVKDAARAIAWAALRDADVGEPVFNLGSGRRTGLREICSAIRQLLPFARLRVASAPRAPSPPSAPLNVRRIRDILGFTPRYGLREGLGDYLHEVGLAAP